MTYFTPGICYYFMNLIHILLNIRIIKQNNINTYLIILLIGGIVGFLSGLLGKGGSAITTPALQIFAGVVPFAALASPLPATLPTTLSASSVYRNKGLVNWRVVSFSILIGIPATLAGSYYTDFFGGNALMVLTALFVLGLGVSFFIIPVKKPDASSDAPVPVYKVSIVAVFVGFLSGLLANSGGVLFGPLFIRFLKMPTKQALASSLVVAAGLAIPGTIAHWYLGHIDWMIVLILSVSSIPSSYFGAKLALRLHSQMLENIFGALLIVFGAFDLWYTLH